MRVLFLTTGCFDKGGISRYSRYQIAALRELYGLANVRVMSLLGPDGNGFETPFEVEWYGGTGGLADKLRFSARAAHIAATWRPDVVHIAHVNFTPLARQLGRIAGGRTLLNVYGLEIWSGLSARRRANMRAMDRIVADCHFTARYVSEANLHGRAPDVIWDCIDLDRFAPGPCSPSVLAKYGIADKANAFVVLSLGRLSKSAAHKGFDRLIEAFAVVAASEPGARLVIAGRGDDRPRLEALVAARGLIPAVTFTGPVDEQDLADVYRSASVFSLVSDRGPGRGEGIPLTPLEAMGCGVPVVVGNQDGSQEAVIAMDGDVANGFVIDPFDLASHAGLLLRMAKSAPLRAQMAECARQAAADHFGYRRFAGQHGVLYADLLAADRNQAAMLRAS